MSKLPMGMEHKKPSKTSQLPRMRTQSKGETLKCNITSCKKQSRCLIEVNKVYYPLCFKHLEEYKDQATDLYLLTSFFFPFVYSYYWIKNKVKA